MNKILILLFATATLFTACTKTKDNGLYTCTCNAKVYASEGFTKDGVVTNKKTFDAGTTNADAQSNCNGKLFWLNMSDTFYLTHTDFGNGYIPGSQITCGL